MALRTGISRMLLDTIESASAAVIVSFRSIRISPLTGSAIGEAAILPIERSPKVTPVSSFSRGVSQ